MRIKDFTVGQVVYAFSYEDIALLKGLKPKKYTVAKIGRKYLYAVRGEEVNIKTVPDYLLIGFKEPDYTDDFLEENIDYGYKTILFPDMEMAKDYYHKRKLVKFLASGVKWESYTLDELKEIQKILGVQV